MGVDSASMGPNISGSPVETVEAPPGTADFVPGTPPAEAALPMAAETSSTGVAVSQLDEGEASVIGVRTSPAELVTSPELAAPLPYAVASDSPAGIVSPEVSLSSEPVVADVPEVVKPHLDDSMAGNMPSEEAIGSVAVALDSVQAADTDQGYQPARSAAEASTASTPNTGESLLPEPHRDVVSAWGAGRDARQTNSANAAESVVTETAEDVPSGSPVVEAITQQPDLTSGETAASGDSHERSEDTSLNSGEEGMGSLVADDSTETKNTLQAGSGGDSEEPPNAVSLSFDENNPNGTRVEDVDKAWDMAKAGDKDRTKAVANRNLTRERVDLNEQWATIPDVPRYRPIKYRRALNRHDKALDKLSNLRDRERAEEQAAKADFGKDIYAKEMEALWKQRFSGKRIEFGDDDKDRAELYDKRDKRLEEWAGILHEHPVSQAYHETHLGVTISPESMVSLEDSIKADLEELEASKKDAEALFGMMLEQKPEDPNVSALANELLDRCKSSDNAEYQRIETDIQTAQAAKVNFFKKLYDTTEIAPRKNEIALWQALLDDVKSGKASA